MSEPCGDLPGKANQEVDIPSCSQSWRGRAESAKAGGAASTTLCMRRNHHPAWLAVKRWLRGKRTGPAGSVRIMNSG